MGAVALALLLGALGFQYWSALPPCEMCHWQRWPHIAAALIGLAGVTLWKTDSRLLVAGVIVIVTALGLAVAKPWAMMAYIVIAALVLVGLLSQVKGARGLAIAAIVLVAVSGLIGAYQWGMQLGLLPGPSACTGQRFVLGSDMVPEISCNAVTWSLFGLSLAAYNALISLGAAALGAVLLMKKPQ
ncbi:MAG: hypothetical protein BGN82_08775 [Alphaproteobacteria bacterium 65-7]|nr:MAG: hypothetical protein BGN82_08775 [Alphaproteobacteria bacterium 65-7]